MPSYTPPFHPVYRVVYSHKGVSALITHLCKRTLRRQAPTSKAKTVDFLRPPAVITTDRQGPGAIGGASSQKIQKYKVETICLPELCVHSVLKTCMVSNDALMYG